MQRAAALSQETVQRLLDDNQQLILATMENQQSGRQAVRIRPSIVFLVRAVGAFRPACPDCFWSIPIR